MVKHRWAAPPGDPNGPDGVQAVCVLHTSNLQGQRSRETSPGASRTRGLCSLQFALEGDAIDDVHHTTHHLWGHAQPRQQLLRKLPRGCAGPGVLLVSDVCHGVE